MQTELEGDVASYGTFTSPPLGGGGAPKTQGVAVPAEHGTQSYAEKQALPFWFGPASTILLSVAYVLIVEYLGGQVCSFQQYIRTGRRSNLTLSPNLTRCHTTVGIARDADLG